MPSKTFLVKSNNDSCNFPGSPTLSKSTVALRSRGTVPGTRSPQGGHRSARMRTAGAAEPPSPPQRGKRLQALRQRPWAARRTSQAGLRRATSLPNRSRFDHDWSAEGSRGHEPRPTPPDTGRRPRRLGARTSAPGTSREAPPTRAPPLPRQPQAPAAAS